MALLTVAENEAPRSKLGVFGEGEKNGITFDSDWICFVTAKKLQ